jgi:peroxiredoxin (alkyl hydroperoxide reductase subunit C)
MARLGEKAPEFEAPALIGNHFRKVRLTDYLGKFVVLYFYGNDFTFI